MPESQPGVSEASILLKAEKNTVKGRDGTDLMYFTRLP